MLHCIDVNALFLNRVFRIHQTSNGVYGTRSLRTYFADMTFSLETPILLLVDSAFLICQERNELFKLAKLFPALPHSGQILQVRNEKKKCFFLFDEAERE